MIIRTRPLIIMLILFLALALTFGSASRYGESVSAAKKNNMRCTEPVGSLGTTGSVSYSCCWEEEGSDGVTRTWCIHCTDTGNFGPDRTSCSNPTSFSITKGPSLPSPPTNVLPTGNTNTSTFPLGSVIKVPPGNTTAAPASGNTTGAPPITKEHNPASPDVFSSAGNVTNPSNNNTGSTGPVVGLTGQHHYDKGSNVGQAETNNGNSPTPPPCPDKGPIPPNCTMKPVIK